MMTFDTFAPGAVIGARPFTFDRAALDAWATLFPADAAAAPQMPAGMIAMVTMRAYMELMADRPPGNVHATQAFSVTRLPRLGDALTTTLRCSGKELRNGRRWVNLASETRDAAGERLFGGDLTMIWAA
jgi:hypothetical protein